MFLRKYGFQYLCYTGPSAVSAGNRDARATVSRVIHVTIDRGTFFNGGKNIAFDNNRPALRTGTLVPLFRQLGRRGVRVYVSAGNDV